MRAIRWTVILSLVTLFVGVSAHPLWAQRAPPTVRSLLTGYGTVGYSSTAAADVEHDFGASVSLVPLFGIEDDVLVEGEVELDLHDGETLVVLEHAEVHYLGFERIQLKAGKFHVPFGIWMHTNWVNRMPTPPLLYEDSHGEPATNGLLPILFDVGAMARWTVPLAQGWRTSAAFWVSQGPRAGAGGHTHDDETEEETANGPESEALPLAYGSNYEDNNADKMTGAQLRVVSAGGLTVQASGFRAAWDDGGDLGVSGLNVSLIWAPRRGPFRLVDLRGEGVVLDQEFLHHEEVESVGYGGYYLQASRRIGAYEPVARWSHLPRAVAGHGPLVEKRRQLAVGLNYWISPSVPVKAAYHWEADGTDGIFIEWAVGF